MYSGGGHCYLLLANTEDTLHKLEDWKKELKLWFLKHFQNELFVACGYVKCSANSLRNIPEGSYSEMFRGVGEKLSAEKMHRYEADEIIWLNSQKADDYTKECKVCKHVGKVSEDGLCPLCSKIQKLSNNVLYSDFFSVVLEGEADGLPLPRGIFTSCR